LSNTLEKWEYNVAGYRIFIDIKKAYDSVRREILYNIPIEYGIPMKLASLVKMCLTETYGTVRVGKSLCDMLQIGNGLEKELLYRHCF
jgi:hypothetical protein